MIRRLLVATDFGEGSAAAEALALEVARAHGASCVLLHAIEAIEGAAEGGGGEGDLEGFFADLRARADRLLAERAARFREGGVPCECEAEVGRRWQVIVERAEAEQVDLIVLGSRRPLEEPGGQPHLGTTSQQVFFAATRPLLVARA